MIKLLITKINVTATATFISLLIMWLLYFIGSNFQLFGLTEKGQPAMGELLIFGLAIMLILSTVIPAIFVKYYEKGNLANLGIHTKKIKTLIGISAFFGIGSLFYYFQLASQQNVTLTSAITYLIYSLLMLWEVLFVYGWLQIRFEKLFGAVGGVVITGLAFALYHVGSVPAEQLLSLLAVGIFGAVLFKLSGKSIFVLWPFFWGVGLAISAAEFGENLTVSNLQLAVTVVAFILQIAFLKYIFNSKNV